LTHGHYAVWEEVDFSSDHTRTPVSVYVLQRTLLVVVVLFIVCLVAVDRTADTTQCTTGSRARPSAENATSYGTCTATDQRIVS
jgi:hypothetical protein